MDNWVSKWELGSMDKWDVLNTNGRCGMLFISIGQYRTGSEARQ